MGTDRNQVFNNGQLVNEETVATSAEEDSRRGVEGRLRAAYTALRQWATDAATSHANWPTMTNAQKDATNRAVVQRFGQLCDGVADLLLILGRDA